MLWQFLLYNKVNQPYTDIYPHIPSLLRFPPTLPISLLQVVTKHQADLPVLCCCFPPAIYFIFGSVYMSILLSLSPSFPFPHTMSSSPFSLSASLFLSCHQVHQYHFFLDSIYMRQHSVLGFLFLTYFTLYERLQVHPPHYK